MNASLEIQSISKTFFPGTPNEKCALNNVSLSVKPGDFITIIGSNGAGKSTLFNAIGGSFYIDAGTILLGDKNITTMADYRRSYDIGRLYQDPMRGTAPSMTIEENLALAYGRRSKKSFFALHKDNRNFFREELASLDLGLEDRLTTKVGHLSGGQRQAVTLLMCTIAQPKLLLLDEHTAALDPATAKKILEVTTRIVEQDSITTMMITHDIHAALQIGNRTIMMDEGQIIMDIKGEERASMTTEQLLACYSREKKKELANDRMLFSI